MELTGGDQASETARFVRMVDQFFDAMNVHNYTHGLYARKPYQMPYISPKDMRLKVLQKKNGFDLLLYNNNFVLVDRGRIYRVFK